MTTTIRDRSEVLHRARLMIGWRDKFGQVPVYRLPHPNGGHDPTAPHPFAAHNGRAVLDCSGFACWAVGWSRRRPGYNEGPGSWVSGHVNTDSLWQDACGRGGLPGRGELVVLATDPQPGDLLVLPGRRAAGIRLSPGHVGILASVPAGIPPGTPEWWQVATAVHCSSRNRPSCVAETSAAVWAKRGRVLRVVG